MFNFAVEDIIDLIKSLQLSKPISVRKGTYADVDNLKLDYNALVSFEGLSGEFYEIVNIDAPMILKNTLTFRVELLLKDPQTNYQHLEDLYEIYYALSGFHTPNLINLKRLFVTDINTQGKNDNGYYLYSLILSASFAHGKPIRNDNRFTLGECSD